MPAMKCGWVSAIALCAVYTLTAPRVCAQVATERTVERDGPIETIEPWYLAGGIAAASAGVGMGILGTWAVLRLDTLQSDPRRERFAEGVPPQLDACGAAETGIANKDYRLLPGAMFPSEMVTRCSDEDELIAIQLVAFPTAVVLSGLGALLIAEAFGQGPDDLQLTTQLGPEYQGAALLLSF
jgi:hypothetical protein